VLDHTLVLPNLVAELAVRDGDRIFLRTTDGEVTTYGQAHDTALRTASAFARKGVEPGDRVVTMLPTAPASVTTWLGLGWLKAIDTGCNTDLKGRLLQHVIESSGARLMAVAAEHLERIAALDSRGPLERIVVLEGEPQAVRGLEVIGKDEFLDGVPCFPTTDPPAPWDHSCIIFTSGTTGPSKGVLNYWGQVYVGSRGIYPHVELDASDVFFAPLPMYHAANRYFVTLAALAGGEAILRRKLDVATFWDDIDRFGVTASFVFPRADGTYPDSTTIRMSYGANLPAGLDEFLDRAGITYSVCYSMTEVSVPITSAGQPVPAGSCGRMREGYPGYELRVVDEHDEPVPHNSVGELIIRAREPWCMNGGYFGMPDKTAEAWRNGWFHTGDAFRQDADGHLYFVDRFKDAIRRRAENISSFEVEAYVNDHPGVVESAAVGVPDDQHAEEEVKVFVVRSPDSGLTADSLHEFLSERMPRFMVPRYVEFIDQLPKTEATYRIQKGSLKALGNTDKTWDRKKAGSEVRS
jgi:crotonobetaine/carnitine-CoA ligase